VIFKLETLDADQNIDAVAADGDVGHDDVVFENFDAILGTGASKHGRVQAAVADERVVAATAFQHVVSVVPDQVVIAVIADQMCGASAL